MSQNTAPAPIQVQNLTYYYPAKCALDQVGFALESGSITALVGPNGAGKSTLLRNLAGLDSPYSGKIWIEGIEIDQHPRLAHTLIGYLPDDFGLYDDLDVYSVLKFIAGCHGLTGNVLEQKIQSVVQTLHLGSVLYQKCSTLSRGWRQRVGIACAIIHSPKILMLDEPASGLDPEARAELSGILKSLQSSGMTILVSSHILAELEEYCTAMLVLRNGKIQEHVTLSSHQKSQQQIMTVIFSEPLGNEQISNLNQAFSKDELILGNQAQSVQIRSSQNPKDHHELLKKLIDLQLPVCSFTLEEKTLQSLYLQIAQQNN